MATETYRFDGMKNDWDNTSRIILEGSTSDPKEWVDLKGHADLSEEKAADLKAHGVKLTKLSPEDAQKVKQAQIDSVSAAASKRGADQMDPQAVLAAQRAAKESQDATPSGEVAGEGSGDVAPGDTTTSRSSRRSGNAPGGGGES